MTIAFFDDTGVTKIDPTAFVGATDLPRKPDIHLALDRQRLISARCSVPDRPTGGPPESR